MNSQEEDIARLLREGKLTPTEAARLRRVFALAGDADAANMEAGSASAAGGRRHWPGLIWLLPVVVLCIAFWLMATNNAGDLSAALQTTDVTSRPIDLGQLDQERSETMQRTVSVSFVTLGLIVAALLMALMAWLYNGLVWAREQVNAGWAQVENQYQRRLDLVPLLIDSVQAYMNHERETLSALTDARARALGTLTSGSSVDTPDETELRALQQAQGEVQAAMTRLLLAVEAYPDLKASQNFRTLQDQIEGTENRVAIERRSYNEFARYYNTRLQTFPANVVGSLAGFRFKPYFEAQTQSHEGIRDAFKREQE
jgi:LemA protein